MTLNLIAKTKLYRVSSQHSTPEMEINQATARQATWLAVA